MVSATVPVLSEVEVWCASTARWVPGFRLAEVRADGRVIILGRDGGPRLPVPFDPECVRPAEPSPASPWGRLTPNQVDDLQLT